MFFLRDCAAEFFVGFTAAGIGAAITYHFKVFFRYMPDKASNEFHGGDGFFGIHTVFMPVVMESDVFPVIVVDAGGCGHWPAKVPANIFDDRFGVAFIRFGINIKTMSIIFVAECLCLFEGRANPGFQFIKECRAESIAQIIIVEVGYIFPKTVVAEASFGDQAVDMRVPF